jgi:hypothetical protein
MVTRPQWSIAAALLVYRCGGSAGIVRAAAAPTIGVRPRPDTGPASRLTPPPLAGCKRPGHLSVSPIILVFLRRAPQAPAVTRINAGGIAALALAASGLEPGDGVQFKGCIDAECSGKQAFPTAGIGSFKHPNP